MYLRVIFFTTLGLYVFSWITNVPTIHKEMLKLSEKEMGEEPTEVASKSKLLAIDYYMPYVSINSEVKRPDYTEEKNLTVYHEKNLSIVIPVFPFVTYYYRKYSSGGFFNYGEKGFLVNCFTFKREIYIRNWIS